jgi:hypothetical protein
MMLTDKGLRRNGNSNSMPIDHAIIQPQDMLLLLWSQ